MRESGQRATCVDRLKVLADETRFAVVGALMDGAQSAGELAERLHVEQSLMSHHLKVMREAGLVEASRHGRAMSYALAPGVRTPGKSQVVDLGCCKISFEDTEGKS